MKKLDADIVLFGGGVAGLWALDSLTHAGYSTLLLEKQRLGQGQTICAQGIVHGGFKYVVPGKYRAGPASEVKHMPQRWRDHLTGKRKYPDLSRVKVSSPSCYFWLSSGRGLRGLVEEAFSSVGIGLLHSTPVDVTETVPEWFKKSAAKVYAVPEPIVDTYSLLQELARPHISQIYYFDSAAFTRDEKIRTVVFTEQESGETYMLSAKAFLLTAGIGNQELVDAMGYTKNVMQIRPLRQLVVYGGNLPDLWGHCIDGGKAVASVTTHYDPRTGEKVWSIGGEVAESGNKMDKGNLIKEGKTLVEKLLRGVDFSGTRWGTFDALRAEEPSDNVLPSGVSIQRYENAYVCFPTKMALAPVLADTLVALLEKENISKTLSVFSERGELHLASYPWKSTF